MMTPLAVLIELTPAVHGRTELFLVAEAKVIVAHLMEQWNNVGVVAACTLPPASERPPLSAHL